MCRGAQDPPATKRSGCRRRGRNILHIWEAGRLDRPPLGVSPLVLVGGTRGTPAPSFLAPSGLILLPRPPSPLLPLNRKEPGHRCHLLILPGLGVIRGEITFQGAGVGGADQGPQPATPTWPGPVLSAVCPSQPQNVRNPSQIGASPLPKPPPTPEASISAGPSGMRSLLAPPGPGKVR